MCRRNTIRTAMVMAGALAAATLGGYSAVAAPAPESVHGSPGKSDPSVTIYLVRHGRTLLNQTETVQGWSDSPLLLGTQEVATAPVDRLNEGRPLARAVGMNLDAAIGDFEVAYSADGKRHFETATYLLEGADDQKLTVVQDPRLREMNFGQYEGKENKEMWTAAVEHLGYTVDHDAPGTAPADENGQNGGWQTMQVIALTNPDIGLYGVTAAIKAVADAPEQGLPAEDCVDTDARMTEALTEIAQAAAKKRQDAVLVVSSGISINCFANAPDMRTVDGAIPAMPPGVPNLGVTKVIFEDGDFAIDGEVGSRAYYPQP